MNRQCSGCTLCCRLLPVRELAKPANHRCKHQSFKGCAIYADRPSSCFLWNCRWLTGDDTGDMRRPDRSHYVIDTVPDFITFDDPEAQVVTIEVVQIWIDPKHPDAINDLDLREYMRRRAREGVASLVRFSATKAMTIFPPDLAADNQWHEIQGESRCEHTPTERLAGIKAARAARSAEAAE